MRLSSTAWLGGCAAALVIGGCSGAGGVGAKDTSVVATSASNGVTVEVLALDNSFRSETITVEAGTVVTWENRGRNDHNVVAVATEVFPGSTWGVAEADFHPGQAYSHLFARPGVYEYVCTIHGAKGKGMVGTITVTG